jgi:hypothetical protein
MTKLVICAAVCVFSLGACHIKNMEECDDDWSSAGAPDRPELPRGGRGGDSGNESGGSGATGGTESSGTGGATAGTNGSGTRNGLPAWLQLRLRARRVHAGRRRNLRRALDRGSVRQPQRLHDGLRRDELQLRSRMRLHRRRAGLRLRELRLLRLRECGGVTTAASRAGTVLRRKQRSDRSTGP